MSELFFICLILLLCAFLWIVLHQKKNLNRELIEEKKRFNSVNELSDIILCNIDAYILLTNKNFFVEKTNYYKLTNTVDDNNLHRVGELLRCKNALDAGACGTHEYCAACPVRNAIKECFRDKKNFSQLEASMQLYLSEKKEDYIDCIVSVSGSYLQLGQEEKVILTVSDITKQKKIQKELEAAKISADLAAEQKTAFLANMSHEIRTPLNAIVGFAGLLPTATEDERNSYTEIIKANTNMLLQLVNDILDMSKIEAGTLEFIYTDVDVNKVMHELEGVFRLRLEETDSPVKIYFKPELPVCFIHTEKNRLSQVISNFLSNALKYTTEGSITLGYELRNNGMYFFVTDTGTGIPADKMDKVFERFTKLDAKRQGTGLGLSISQTIVKRLGGTIGVESKIGSGSTFWFTLPSKPFDFLPIKTSEVENKQTTNPSGTLNKTECKTILIAEDMDDNYELYKAYLGKKYKLVRAVNGEEAISRFLECNPDVILMDIGMPLVDGYQATDAIRQLESNVPIVAVTAFAYHEEKKKVLSRGFNGFLPKPLDRTALLEMLHKMGV
ncbi:ATP-binding response regulator [Phocaeicola sp.]